MCTSIIFAVKLRGESTAEFTKRVEELGREYEYGIGMGPAGLLPGARGEILAVLEPCQVIFEVHDLQEEHCACDIDEDIRVASKLGGQSEFFDFCREILVFPGLSDLSLLIFQDFLPTETNLRQQQGSYAEFVALVNKWHTWQVEGFEPNRGAYLIVDESPLLYKFMFPA